MDREPRPWYHRLMTGLPPISDRVFALFFVALLVGVGVALGMVLCMAGRIH